MTPVDDVENAPSSSGRMIAGALVFLVLSLVGGALAAPVLFRMLLALGRAHDSLHGLRDLTFESVAARAVLIMAVVLAVPMARWSGFRTWRSVGVPLNGRMAGPGLLAGLLLGLVSIAAIVAGAVLAGPYEWRMPSALPALLGAVLGGLATGIAVSLIEEVLFRGYLYRALAAAGHWVSILAGSALFSLIHFADPMSGTGIVHPGPLDGLWLIPGIFPFSGASIHYLPYGITLFVMGVVLCRLACVQGHIWGAIGLHAGWVWGLQAVRDAVRLDPAAEEGSVLFLLAPSVEKAPLTLLMLFVFWGGIEMWGWGKSRGREA